jgi:membrane-associated phospholipid phosphatase
MAFVTHLRGLWGNWWWLPPVGAAVALAVMAALSSLRPEIVIIILAGSALAVWNARTKDLLITLLPAVGIVAAYEAVRYVSPIFVTPERVVGCELRDFERMFVSIGGQTLPEYFATRHAPFFDLLFAIPYTAFWMVAVAYGLWLYFADRLRLRRYIWLLAAAYIVAIIIWMVLPSAPPWYVIQNGCAVDLQAAPSAAALLRVDQLLGISYFEGFYSRSPNVFGALPSLHCAFPMAGLLAAWRDVGWPQRLVHIVYTLWMVAASIYLTHHWLIDGLTGIAIVLLACFLVVRFLPSAAKPVGASQRPSSDPSAAP